MKFSLKKANANSASHQTLVVFVAKLKEGKKLVIPGLEKNIVDFLQPSFEDEILTGAKKECILFRSTAILNGKNLLVLGCGESTSNPTENLRDCVGHLTSELKKNKSFKISIHLSTAAKVAKNSADAVEGVVQGLKLGVYAYNDHLGNSNKEKKKNKKEISDVELLLSGSQTPASMKSALSSAETVSECINFARRLGDAPGNLMTPTILANETMKEAKSSKLKVTVWDKARIKKEKMGGLYGVALGSSQDPRFIIMKYNGAAASKKPVCFVGKGLTFDCGGISIKPSQGMDEMKYDMCGGAAVISTLIAVARLKLNINVIGLVSASENMPGPAANKPGDILTARNGKTFEVLNTDAEGRLILADALSYASELKPAAIFDAATLTGAVLVALGNIHTGVFTRDNKLMSKIQKASDKSGELIWQLPLNNHHSADIKGHHADLRNIGTTRGAGSSTAAAFLEHFVDEKIPWAHFDIAGTAWNVSNRLSYCPKGASGAIIRTFIELAKAH